MTDGEVDSTIRQAIGGDADAISWIVDASETIDDALVIAMAAVLQGERGQLDRARQLALTSRDRQVVAIAIAHVDGRKELVDALARDHLVDYPDSLIVSWIAGSATT